LSLPLGYKPWCPVVAYLHLFYVERERERERFITSLSFASGERNLGGLSRWVGTWEGESDLLDQYMI